MATVDDVVRESGVSRSTVFRFLKGNNVRSDARRSILDAMEKLNYRNGTLHISSNYTIEISISNNFEGFKGFADVVQGIMERADEKGIKVNLCRRTGNDIPSCYSKWDCKDANKGVIIVGKEAYDEELEAKILLSKKIPHVFINRIFDTGGINWVSVDIERAACDAVEHLISNGHRKIAVIGQPGRLRIDRDKINGLKNALLMHEMSLNEASIIEVDDEGDFVDGIYKILTSKDRPTAIFAICDSHAMKIIHMAGNLGIRIPEDIAVIGMDDIEGSEYFKPSLSTIHIPFKKMGIVAVDNLISLISDPEISGIRTVISHKLIIRESSGEKPALPYNI